MGDQSGCGGAVGRLKSLGSQAEQLVKMDCDTKWWTDLLPGGLSFGFIRFAAYVVTSVGFSGSGDRERDERVAFGAFLRICLPMR